MSNIKINSFPTRKQYTYAGGAKVFVIDFPFFENVDIFVYVSNPATNGTQEDPENLILEGIGYTLTGAGLPYGGEVTVLPAVNLPVGYTVTIVGRMVIDRYSILETTSAITRAQYNEDMNRLTCMIQQINTIVEQTMPKYDRSEFINTDRTLPNTPFSYVNLPWLPAGYTWAGNADETGLTIFKLSAGGGVGFVTADHIGMNPSIALWTGTDFVLTDSAINIVGTNFVPLVAGASINIDDTASALGWPRHGTAQRAAIPANGMVYYDTDLGGYYGYFGGNWQRFAFGGETSVVQETVIQANNFAPNDVIRRNKDTNLYVKAQGNSKENAAVCAIVIAADANQFTMQFIGKVTNPNNNWIDGNWYFLSAATQGLLTTVEPTTNGQISVPLLVATSSSTGIFLNMRGFVVGNGSTVDQGEEIVIKTINQPGHGFVMQGFVVKPSKVTPGVYIAADSTDEDDGYGTGMIREIIDIDNFKLQQSGYMPDLDTVPPVPGGVKNSAEPFDLGVSYYIDPAKPGELTTAKPGTPNYAKPQFQPDQTNAGWVLPAKPTQESGGGGGTGPIILYSEVINNVDTVTASGVITDDYKIVQIVGTDLIFAEACYLVLQVESNGVFVNTAEYTSIGGGASGGAGAGGAYGQYGLLIEGYGAGIPRPIRGNNAGVINQYNKTSFTIDALAPYTASKYRTMNSWCEFMSALTGTQITEIVEMRTYWPTFTTARFLENVTGYRIVCIDSAGNPVDIVSGTFTVYGTKGTP